LARGPKAQTRENKPTTLFDQDADTPPFCLSQTYHQAECLRSCSSGVWRHLPRSRATERIPSVYGPPAHSHTIHSPYMFGRSPRRYASNVRLSTALHARSRSSFSGPSAHSGARSSVGGGGGEDGAPPSFAARVGVGAGRFAIRDETWRARARRSVVVNRGPRSGKLRPASTGSSLACCGVSEGAGETTVHAPVVMPVVRVRASEERIKACGCGVRAGTRGRLEELVEPVAGR
jgi:hypothetical protein